MSEDKSRQTRAVRAAVHTDTQHGAVMPPVYLSSNFAFEGLGKAGAYDYTRTANPTRDALAGALNELEGGAGATVTASGMAAIHLTCQVLNPGDLVIGPSDCYGGTFRLLTQCARRGLFDVELIDQSDPAALDAAVARRPLVRMHSASLALKHTNTSRSFASTTEAWCAGRFHASRGA